MFVDASAIIAILLCEAGYERLAETIDASYDRALVTNVIAVWEVVATLRTRRGATLGVVEAETTRFLNTARIETLAVGANDLTMALAAFERYGRHRIVDPRQRNKALNLADCFHYATAKSRHIPILTIDEGFSATDLEVARIN